MEISMKLLWWFLVSGERSGSSAVCFTQRERGGYSHIYFPLDFEEIICEILRVNTCRVNAETAE
jgi:hypothetical protein